MNSGGEIVQWLAAQDELTTAAAASCTKSKHNLARKTLTFRLVCGGKLQPTVTKQCQRSCGLVYQVLDWMVQCNINRNDSPS